MLKKISSSEFSNFGWKIGFPGKQSYPKQGNRFKIILKEKRKVGWRIACLLIKDKAIDRLEQHKDSFESFEPLSGKVVLFLAQKKNPKAIKSFLLDKMVILKKGIWHGIIVLGSQAEIKITENACVSIRYWRLNSFLKLAGK